MPRIIAAWRAAQRRRSAFRCTPQPLAALRRWRMDEPGLAHETGGFFRIIAIRTESSDPALDGSAQPFILQPEVGILGFLRRPGPEGPELLIQAKTEPGNIGAVQLSPTFQCTPSNYTARHGGTPAPYLDAFAHSTGTVLSDLRQSEQGTRFLGKFNRNMVVELPAALAPEPAGPAWRWLPVADVLPLLGHNNMLNTDARSILVSTPWRHWAASAPFARHRHGFGAALRAAYDTPAEDLASWLHDLRDRTVIANTHIPLAALSRWHTDETAVAPVGKGSFAIRGYRVTARDREVAHWDQPLVDSAGLGCIVLLCRHHAGTLQFLVQAHAEPGLGNKVEITASLQIAPGDRPAHGAETTLAALARNATTHISCRQSEEGGRFYRDGNEYRIAELPPGTDPALPGTWRWVTLPTLEALCTSGMVTNEGRSAISLLLSLI